MICFLFLNLVVIELLHALVDSTCLYACFFSDLILLMYNYMWMLQLRSLGCEPWGSPTNPANDTPCS